MVKFSDFKTITRSKKIPEFICNANDIFNYAWELLLEHYDFFARRKITWSFVK